MREGSSKPSSEVMEHGILTFVADGLMAVDDYFSCLKLGCAIVAELFDFLRNNLKSKGIIARVIVLMAEGLHLVVAYHLKVVVATTGHLYIVVLDVIHHMEMESRMD